MIQHKQNYISHLTKTFKDLASCSLDTLIDENLLSPFVLELPQSLLPKISSFIDSFYQLRESSSYQEALQEKYQKNIINPGNKSLFMSYDFHLTEEGQPKLIEINTNAAFLALGYYFYEYLQLPTGIDFKLSDLQRDILEELRLNEKKTLSPKVLIIDEEPSRQKLFAEFLVYQQLIQSFGWDCKIADYKEFSVHHPDFVYNRWTDFYFERPESKLLQQAFTHKETCFSPNPFEYFLQADKQRLVDINNDSFWSQIIIPEKSKSLIRDAIPVTKLIVDYKIEELWEQRKQMFFKPINSFGSKQTYRGQSISRKLFDELNPTGFLAQEFVPAAERTFTTDQGPETFKFDLRCYAYKNKLQLVIARLYKGQVTNLKTPYGGFTPIKWV